VTSSSSDEEPPRSRRALTLQVCAAPMCSAYYDTCPHLLKVPTYLAHTRPPLHPRR
jgi:hypothetical protein